VRGDLERRIARLEERWRLAREQAAFRDLLDSDESPDEYFDRLHAQLSELEAVPIDGRIAAATRDLATLEADIARADPQSRRLLEYCRRHYEINLLELKAEISPEQLWVAREQACKTVRGTEPFSPIPTHEKAVELLEAGTVGCHSFMPADLARCYSRAPEGKHARRSVGHTQDADGSEGYVEREEDLDGA
jgi:hypothetical protein